MKDSVILKKKADKTSELSGIVPPLVTPFKEDGSIDYTLFRNEVRQMVGLGIAGISVGGSNGEGATLSEEELVKLIQISSDEVNGKVKLVCGIIVDSTYQAIRKALAVKQLGVDYLMITPIHYLDNSGEMGLYEYYKEIYKKAGIPIIVYNVVPWYVATPSNLIRMHKDGFIAAVKQSGGDIHALGELLALAKSDMPIMTAIDDMMYPSFMLGSVGSICAMNTLIPRSSLRLLDYVKNRDYDRALELHERILPMCKKILTPNMPSRIKFAMNKTGWRVGVARKPILPLSEQETAELNVLSKEVSRLEGV